MFQLQIGHCLLNIEFTISIMSTPTKLILDNTKLVFFCGRVKCFYISSTYCIYFTKKLFSQSETIFINDEHKILSWLSLSFALFVLFKNCVN